mgnify:CR=1 FL=1
MIRIPSVLGSRFIHTILCLYVIDLRTLPSYASAKIYFFVLFEFVRVGSLRVFFDELVDGVPARVGPHAPTAGWNVNVLEISESSPLPHGPSNVGLNPKTRKPRA